MFFPDWQEKTADISKNFQDFFFHKLDDNKLLYKCQVSSQQLLWFGF